MKSLKKMILSIMILSVIFSVLATVKIPYYQLASKDGVYRKHISISKLKYDALIAAGWTFTAFDKESDIPQNPILDNGLIREQTAAELTAAINAKKLARTIFSAQSIIEAIELIDKENGNTDLSTKLLTILSSNPAFTVYWGAYSRAINLEHPVCVAALSNFTATEIETLKLKIP